MLEKQAPANKEEARDLIIEATKVTAKDRLIQDIKNVEVSKNPYKHITF